jgi:hypothetical protein
MYLAIVTWELTVYGTVLNSVACVAFVLTEANKIRITTFSYLSEL